MTRCVYSKRVGMDFKDTSQSLHSQTTISYVHMRAYMTKEY